MREIINKLPLSPGIYIFKDKAGAILYVGKAKNLRARVRSYFNKKTELSLSKQDMIWRVADLEIVPAQTENEALILEAMHIKKRKPPYNVVLKDDKDYSFVKIDYREDYPTVSIVRRPKLDDQPQKFFGPFTSSFALNENLRFLRRIFPYRKKAKALTKFEHELLRKRSIGPLPQTRAEYLAMIKKLEKIIDGQTAAVKRELKKRMQTLARRRQYETAAQVRDQIKWLDIFVNRQPAVSAKEYLQSTRPLPTALSELKLALKLKNVPQRIEGYDISNIQGRHSVGSMVVFTNSEPDKNEYRKFKIRTVKGANDFAMLSEVLRRRFKHLEWSAPDLVLLDGGKGQLATVLNSLTSYQLPVTNNQFIALAKQHEEIFQGLGGRKIILSPDSPASRLLQRIRDEAHRFAQKYYHTLHSKSYAKNKSGKT